MKIKVLSIMAASALLLGGCTKNILDINTNPNTPTYTTPQQGMPAALVGTASLVAGDGGTWYNGTTHYSTDTYDLGFWMGYVAGNNGFAPSQQLQTYNINASNFNYAWQNYYLNISNYNVVKQLADQQNLPLYSAICQVMMAYDFSCLVDVYNDIPYTDALLKKGNFAPKYDKGSDVYDSCVALIDSAITTFKYLVNNSASISPTDNTVDIMYGAKPAQWLKYANSLKLRLLINQSKVSGKQAYIKQEIAKIDPAQLMGIGDDALVNPPYQSTAMKTNPLYGRWYSKPGTTDDPYKMHVMNTYALSTYQNNQDPRIAFFYDQTSGAYKANNFGTQSPITGSPLGTATSSMNKILNPTAPAPVLTAAEALFDEAEAIQLGWLPGDAETAYNNAITASFKYTGDTVISNHVNDYLAQPTVAWGNTANKIQLIISQKWAALNFIDLVRVYDDYRRTGYPKDIPLSIAPGHLASIPTRFLYPSSETQTNGANVPKVTSTDKVFWNQ